MPVKQTLFYATIEDLHYGLASFEEACAIKYVRTGLFDSPEPIVYMTYRDIENIGLSLDGRIENLTTYLILERDDNIEVKKVLQRRGGVKYSINSRFIPSSITFTPSGVYGGECIIYGTITGVDVTDEKSKNLFKLFGKHVLKGFEKIKTFKVSPSAANKLDDGIRLTPNFKADQSMDLCR
ncbi:hypothetical protein V4T45_001458 [Vibrio vulnificus]|uniref:hypothetical protein n=1 Tax=Vibrio vulnificus TaxID=672 RepID=UPI000CD19C65|nr:hypothetical protein [Vibrio vulnificus]EHU4916621.1 hypothetical protein [Vibrio vulnificus]EHU5003670.1 hypothetical protein [Vibrio vulnificus]EHZ2743299.1 hypothetical protein [Vibrio vulnificus]ELR8704387.1 hypothetical protein [Vibrio vulnificus]ELR8772631.1 hypothetical protein [Vibrio vulnificus]